MRVLAHRYHVSWRLRFEDLSVLLPAYVEASNCTVMQTENGMIHQKKCTGHRRRELDYSRTSRRNQGRLQTARRRRNQVAFPVHFVEYLANDMERRNQVGSGVPNINPYGFILRRDGRPIFQQR